MVLWHHLLVCLTFICFILSISVFPRWWTLLGVSVWFPYSHSSYVKSYQSCLFYRWAVTCLTLGISIARSLWTSSGISARGTESVDLGKVDGLVARISDWSSLVELIEAFLIIRSICSSGIGYQIVVFHLFRRNALVVCVFFKHWISLRSTQG